MKPEISREPESTAFSQETENAAVEIPAAAGSELPSRYDARKDDRTAPVKNQGDLGTCWAFASLLALESSLLPEESFDFSEDHMSHDPNFLLDQKSGGDYIMSMRICFPGGDRCWKRRILTGMEFLQRDLQR